MASGQVDSLKSAPKRLKILPVPTFGYSPETETYIGVVSLFTLDLYQDGYTRTSNAKVEVTYTWNKQMILELGWDYFFKKEKWFSQGEIHISKYPDRYYGIGTNTLETDQIWFNSNRYKATISLLRSVKAKMFIGSELSFMDFNNVSYSADMVYEELVDRKNLQISAVFLWDSRNNLLNATSGSFLRAAIGESINELKNNFRSKLDMRAYKTWNKKYTLAARAFTELNFNEPTFYNYAILGGDKFVRGYLYGRFRESNMATLQIESRNHLFWRIGLAVFGGYSYMFKDLKSTNATQFKYNYGAGLRFLVDKKGDINLRFDYAVGEDGQNAFYVAFGESF